MKNKKNILDIQINKIKALETSDNIVKFSKPLVITDNTEQFNGTRYDIPTMNIDSYRGHLTINHSDDVQDIVGDVIGLQKEKNKVTIDGINFAIKENAMAQFAKDMLLGGRITDFSIETIGPWPEEDGVWKDSQLVGLSMVIAGNNKSASLNEIVLNSINKAKENGLDTGIIEKNYLTLDNQNNTSDNKEDMKFVTIKNSQKFAVEVSFKNRAGEDSMLVLNVGQSFEVSEDQKEAVEKQINDAVEVKVEKKEVNVDEAVKNAVAPLMEKIEKMETTMFDNSANEPKFRKATFALNSGKYADMDYKARHGKQINLAWDMLKGGNAEAGIELREINQFNLEQLKEKKIVDNQVTIADFGNFVISPELLTDIEGVRSDYSPLLNKVSFKETLSLQMAWLTRSGDIDMQEVEMCDDGADGNLKPISEYGADIKTSNLHELAAVTPVCNAATRFLAVDLLGDVAAGYRNDFDKKKAQLVIARLQQAVNDTGNSAEFDVSTDLDSLKSLIAALKIVVQKVPNGGFIFNNSTYWTFVEKIMGAGIAGPLATIFTTGDQPALLGKPYVVVPDDLMPTLGMSDTKVFTIEGASVTINQGLFYLDFNTFTGRTSGGLNFDLSTEAAYEVSGETRSAFQRNELVLRGSFFRGGAVKDADKVAGLSDFSIS